jgi:hypothetical protein
MANPIRTSDLYTNTGELKTLLEELKAVEAQYLSFLKKIEEQAATLQVSIDGLNVSQEAHREEIKKAAKQADKLEKEHDKLSAAYSENNTKIQALRLATRKMNNVKKNEAKLAMAAEGSYDALSAQYSLNKIRLNQMSAAQRANTKEGKELVKQSREIYEEMKRLQEETGKHTLNVGNYKDATRELIDELDLMPGSLQGALGGVQRLGAGFKALLANPVVLVLSLIVGGLAALFNAFRKSEKGAQLMAKATGFVQGILSSLVGIATSITESLTKMWEDPLGALKNFGKALVGQVINRFTGLIGILKAVGKAFRALWERDLEGLRKAAEEAAVAVTQVTTGLDAEQQREVAAAFEETRKQVERNTTAFMNLETAKRNVARANIEIARSAEALRTEEARLLQIQEDDTLGFEVRQQAALKAREATIALAREEIKIARNNLGLLNREIALRESNGEDVLALQEQQLGAFRSLAQAERDYTLALLDGDEKRRRLKQDELERDLDILIDGFANQQAINQRRLKDDQLTFEERRRILEETARLGEDSFQRQIETIQEFTDQAVDANGLLAESDAVVLNEKIRALGLSEIIEGRLLEIIRDRKTAVLDLAEAEVELAQAAERAASERLAALNKQADEIHRAEMEGFDQRQALAEAEFALLDTTEAEKTKFRLEAERARFAKILELNEQFAGDLSDTEIATYRALIEGINQELDKLAAEGQSRNLFDLLGLNLSDEYKQSLKDAFSFAKEQLAEWAAFRTEQAEAAVSEADGEVEAARERLQNEIDNRNQGSAHKVGTAEKELQEAKKNQARALQEQRKAERAERAIQSAQQAVNLVTASTKIWAQFGFPAALVPLGIMWGSFISSKIRAAQLTKKENRLGSFEWLGTSQNNPGAEDIYLGPTSDGRMRTASKGEGLAIFNRGAAAKYGQLLPELVNAANRGALEKVISRTDYVPEFFPIAAGVASVNMQTTESELRKIRRQGAERTYINDKGQLVEIRGNKKITYR